MRKTVVGLLVSLLAACATPAPVQAEVPASVRVQRDIVYGTGVVDADTIPRARPLRMDAYLPAVSDSPVPAILMIFGGAYHRGTKEDVSFSEDGAQDSSMARYCSVFAGHGIACFAIEYRLTPESPAFPESLSIRHTQPKALLEDAGATSRIELVRRAMGLPPLDAASREQFWAAIFAAVEDAQTALAYVRERADAFGIDPSRIAVGVFSSGAITALNLAYGAGADVSAVVSLSGGVAGYDLLKDVPADGPPVLLLVGQTDLPGQLRASGLIARKFDEAGVDVTTAWVPGFGHFYPMGATSLGADFSKLTVEERVLAFLGEANIK